MYLTLVCTQLQWVLHIFSVSLLPFVSVTKIPEQCKGDMFLVYFNTKIGLR